MGLLETSLYLGESMEITNVHERQVAASPVAAGRLLDSLSSGEDLMWPPAWPRQRFDRAMQVGARGGHGPIRYEVEAYEPGRHVGYRFRPGIGVFGRHWFDVVPMGDQVRLCHVVRGRAGPAGWLGWNIVFRWLHDALIEDAFDRAEQTLTGTIRQPQRWSPWVRTLRWLLDRR